MFKKSDKEFIKWFEREYPPSSFGTLGKTAVYNAFKEVAEKAWVEGRRAIASIPPTKKPYNYPYGKWRCMHAAEWAQTSGFIPGEIYECRKDAAGGPRIFPNTTSSWAPYWIEKDDKFCYPSSDMRFEYIGD